MRSAMRLRISARSAAEVRDHAGKAPWAASRARSTSAALERATSVKGRPVSGETSSK